MTGQLQRELRQSRPFASRRIEAHLNLVRTADTLARLADAILKPHDLSVTTYNVLRILRGAGPAGQPVGEVGSRLVSREPDVTRLIDRLERRRLVERGRDGADRRVVRVTITAAGRALVERIDLDRQLHDAHAPHLGTLSAAELDTLITLCERIRGAPSPG
jgi:DNA-binding MarR family transcriptional regulator